MARKPPKAAIAPLGQHQSPREAGFWAADKNEDGSTAGRKAVAHCYVGLDVTPTFSVASEFDEVVRLIAHGFEEGTVAVLQAVFGDNSGTQFSTVMIDGIPATLTHEHTVITVPFSGRFRLLFENGWSNSPDACVSELRQQRIPPWDNLSGGVLLWERTGEVECRDGILWHQEVNQHGRIRWVTDNEDCGWESTNEFQCRDDGLYEQEVNRAGDTRWVKVADDCGWTGTNEFQCRDDDLYEREVNKAGDYRWTLVAEGDCGWVGTGELQCRPGDPEGLFEREVNKAGDVRWTKIADGCGWEGTGEFQCRDDGLYERMRNRAGDYAWFLLDGDCGWVGTGELQCRQFGDGDEGLFEREINRAGDVRWTQIDNDCGWESANEFQCRADHLVYEKHVNRAGDVRWEETTETCYDPTYNLPCGGWAFGPGDIRDPAATVELTDCQDDTGMGVYIYPTPAPGHTVPIGDCFSMCLVPDDIVGYAANKTITGVENKCYDGPRNIACVTGNSPAE